MDGRILQTAKVESSNENSKASIKIPGIYFRSAN